MRESKCYVECVSHFGLKSYGEAETSNLSPKDKLNGINAQIDPFIRHSARPRQTSHFELHSDRIQKARDEDFEQLVFLKTPSKPIGSIVTFSGSHQARNVLALPHSVNLNGINAQTAQNILLGYVAGAGRVFITKISLKCHRFSVCIACLNADGREEISKEKISQGFRSGDLVLDVKDLLQMPHPSSPRKYLLS
ncbi:hypothetical protein Zmor_014477 [Zophobas morio]|uniref:Uncharacterized protein n=1 Tax=Zophobas morio TaxID=2755281 RepID=A0AA38MGH2_9CUCU|nr:hypothetical protein Zmor_014477 [Zophobas morio]